MRHTEDGDTFIARKLGSPNDIAIGYQTDMRLHQGEDWQAKAHDSGYQYYCHDHDKPVRAVMLRRVGWLDQKGRVWTETPATDDFDGGSLTPLLINPGCD